MRAVDGHDLEWLLDYELSQSTRHRRFVSLVMLSANGSTARIEPLINGALRDSDVLFTLDHAVAVLMGETERKDAALAVDRYKEAIGEVLEVQCGVASFPEDAKATTELINRACRQLSMQGQEE